MLRTFMRSLMPRSPGVQRADAAHDQLHLHARLRGAIQLLHHVLVQQRIHLHDDPRRLARPCVVGLARNQVGHPLGQIHRGHQQRVVVRLLGVRGQKVEDVVHRHRHLRIGRQQTQIGIERRRRRVVVARPQVRIAADGAVGFLARNQRQLAVRLQSHQSVEDLHPRIFQLARPLDVGGLVEARFHLHHHRHFLALPPPARSASTIGELSLVRYSVCLIESTAGSCAAASINDTTLL